MENIKTYRLQCLNAILEKDKSRVEKEIISLIKKAISKYPIYTEFYLVFNSNFAKSDYFIDEVEDLIININSKFYATLTINNIYEVLKNHYFLKSCKIELQSNLEYILLKELVEDKVLPISHKIKRCRND